MKCLKGSGENKTRTEKKHTYTIYMLLTLVYTVMSGGLWSFNYRVQNWLHMYILSHTHWKSCSNFVGPALCLRYYKISFSDRIYQILYPRARKSTTHLTLLHSVAELMRQMTRKMACFFRHLGNEVSRNENDNSHFRSHLLLLSSYSWMISTKIACFDRSLSQTSYG